MAIIKVDYGTIGGGLPIGCVPDVSNITTETNTGTTTIPVTQKPKYIFISLCQSNNSNGFLGMIDVNNNMGYRLSFWGDARHIEPWNTFQSFFTSITNSEVVYDNSTWSSTYTSRAYIAIYY